MRKLKLEELNRLEVDQYKQVKKLPVVIVLDNIRSLFNVGAVFRTADAFRISAIHLCGITATPPHREIHKTALGATESVEWEYFEDVIISINSLREQGYKVYAIEQTDQSIEMGNWKLDAEEKVAVVFGNEVKGVSESILPLAHACIEIPQYGTKHSLNVSVSAGIVIWNIFNQMRAGNSPF